MRFLPLWLTGAMATLSLTCGPLVCGSALAAAAVGSSTNGASGSSEDLAKLKGLRSKINHVVVIYQENWSFDGLYGKFPGANGLANAGDAVKQVDKDGKPLSVLPQPLDPSGKPDPRFPANLPVQPYDINRYVKPQDITGDLVHRFYTEQLQIDGGKMDKFATWSDNGGLTLSYFDASNLPEGRLAQQYTMADNFFHAAFGGSFLNHFWLIGARSPVWPQAPASYISNPDPAHLNDNKVTPDGYAVNTSFSINQPHPASITDPAKLVPNQTYATIGDRLSSRGVSWAWFAGGWNNALAGHPDPLFQFHHQPFAYFKNYADGTPAKAAHLKDEQDFFAAVSSGTLPSVSFIKPLGPDNEHPGYSSVLRGQQHVAQIVSALQNSPFWNDTAVIVTYDENGGRWDHVAPPVVDRWGPGTRVPAIIISPYAKKAFVDHTPYDTTSILKLIERRWSLAPLSSRDAAANDMTNAFDFSQGLTDPEKRVLLLSVDGLHGLDLANYVQLHPDSNLAKLSKMGVTYSNASGSKPSDSFPGLLAMITGGSPASTGVFYDDSYDRALSPPGSACGTTGTEVAFDESIDKNPNALDGGGGIDPAKLPRDPRHGCRPVYPHNYLRVNTLFEVVRNAGGRTAWTDKHPAYDIVNGPSGRGVEDLFTPEIAANGTTGSVAKTEAYDDLKVQAILNEVDGKDHSGTRTLGVPNIFGMNFQAVSVAQKLPGGGYTSSNGTPSAMLQDALDHTDASLGKMVAELQRRGLFNHTVIILTAKHGQAPIDPTKLRIIDKSIIPNIVDSVSSSLLIQATQDDVALLWLRDQSQTAAVVQALRAHQEQAGIQNILWGESLKKVFNDPTQDSRTPDIIVIPRPGVVYAKPTKIAEHGGFSDDDTNVALLVASPSLARQAIKTPVQTTQIAPTILSLLHLNPAQLQAVRLEHTDILPGFESDSDTSAAKP